MGNKQNTKPLVGGQADGLTLLQLEGYNVRSPKTVGHWLSTAPEKLLMVELLNVMFLGLVFVCLFFFFVFNCFVCLFLF